MSELYIVDVETASLQGGIVELAYLRCDMELNVLEEFCERVNPEREIEKGAMAVHGITNEEVADCQTISEVTKQFIAPVIFVAHNASFDRRMLDPFIQAKQTLCTLALSRQFVKNTSNHKLATLQSELQMPKQKSHSAAGDVASVRDLLLRILPLAGVGMQTLLDRANVPKLIAKMPFGKYKGITILRVPKDYRDWLLAQEGLDQDLHYTLTKFKDL